MTNQSHNFRVRASLLTALVIALVAGASAQPNGECPTSAINIKVDCDKKQTINAALACASYSSRPVTLDISGTCKENVVIQGADRITLAGHNGASIVDQSNGANETVGIYFSSLITVQDLTIVGGDAGVLCTELSSCLLENNIVQNANNGLVVRSRSAVEGFNNTFQNNSGFGVWVANFGNHTSTVYKPNASGDTAPLRVIRSAKESAGVPGMGNPHPIAYDTKRQELLVPN